jgi:hypothetical protein
MVPYSLSDAQPKEVVSRMASVHRMLDSPDPRRHLRRRRWFGGNSWHESRRLDRRDAAGSAACKTPDAQQNRRQEREPGEATCAPP